MSGPSLLPVGSAEVATHVDPLWLIAWGHQQGLHSSRFIQGWSLSVEDLYVELVEAPPAPGGTSLRSSRTTRRARPTSSTGRLAHQRPPAVGRRSDLCQDRLALLLRRVRRRLLRTDDRRVAGVALAAHRPRLRRLRAGDLGAPGRTGSITSCIIPTAAPNSSRRREASQSRDRIDAIHAAARLLCANDASGGADIPAALYSYDHARWYVPR